MSKAIEALKFIEDSLATGKSVCLTNAYKSTVVTPKNYNKWKSNGWVMFKLAEDGHLLMASGKNFLRIVTPTMSLMKIEAI